MTVLPLVVRLTDTCHTTTVSQPLDWPWLNTIIYPHLSHCHTVTLSHCHKARLITHQFISRQGEKSQKGGGGLSVWETIPRLLFRNEPIPGLELRSHLEIVSKNPSRDKLSSFLCLIHSQQGHISCCQDFHSGEIIRSQYVYGGADDSLATFCENVP